VNKASNTLRPRISGTGFIDPSVGADGRLSLSASFRGHGHAVTGTSSGGAPAAIDTPAGETCVVCAPATLRLAEELFERWNDALKSGDPDKVTACYAEDAVLLPTVSNVPRTNHAEIRDYFVHFLMKGPRRYRQPAQCEVRLQQDHRCGHLHLPGGGWRPELQVPARYTFVYENRDDQWLIVHHHSSKMPD
jgi:uncharacterized protein (TIGR02246 family)